MSRTTISCAAKPCSVRDSHRYRREGVQVDPALVGDCFCRILVAVIFEQLDEVPLQRGVFARKGARQLELPRGHQPAEHLCLALDARGQLAALLGCKAPRQLRLLTLLRQTDEQIRHWLSTRSDLGCACIQRLRSRRGRGSACKPWHALKRPCRRRKESACSLAKSRRSFAKDAAAHVSASSLPSEKNDIHCHNCQMHRAEPSQNRSISRCARHPRAATLPLRLCQRQIQLARPHLFSVQNPRLRHARAARPASTRSRQRTCAEPRRRQPCVTDQRAPRAPPPHATADLAEAN
eukprot:6196817-Pleurochrysis_carterae.AAC.2